MTEISWIPALLLMFRIYLEFLILNTFFMNLRNIENIRIYHKYFAKFCTGDIPHNSGKYSRSFYFVFRQMYKRNSNVQQGIFSKDKSDDFRDHPTYTLPGNMIFKAVKDTSNKPWLLIS